MLATIVAAGCGGGGAADQQNSEQNELTTQGEAGGNDESGPAVASEEDSRAGTAAAPGTVSRRTLDEAPGPPATPAARWRELTIPAGTALPLELASAVSTQTATVEMPVSARLRSAITVDGVTVLPAGTVFSGQVIDVERPGRVEGRARLALRFTQARVDGELQDIRTNPITLEGEATKGEDATKIGAGAGIGAVVGGIIGGGDGAAKGAAIGGAAGTGAVLATRGRDLELASGTDLRATVASPAIVRVENR